MQFNLFTPKSAHQPTGKVIKLVSRPEARKHSNYVESAREMKLLFYKLRIKGNVIFEFSTIILCCLGILCFLAALITTIVAYSPESLTTAICSPLISVISKLMLKPLSASRDKLQADMEQLAKAGYIDILLGLLDEIDDPKEKAEIRNKIFNHIIEHANPVALHA